MFETCAAVRIILFITAVMKFETCAADTTVLFTTAEMKFEMYANDKTILFIIAEMKQPCSHSLNLYKSVLYSIIQRAG